MAIKLNELLSELTTRPATQAEVEYLNTLIFVDEMTGVVRKDRFDMVIDEAEKIMQRTKEPALLVQIDFNRLKVINDTFGHLAGDLAVTLIANRIKEQLRPDDKICRTGGDEFTLILTGARMEEWEGIKVRYERKVTTEPLDLKEGRTAQVMISLGAVEVTLPCDWNAAMQIADDRCYADKKAKKAGRDM